MTTPARRQYLEIKAQHPDALLMYQVGDFFEFFDDDARVAAHALQIVLTSRSYGPTEQVPLAGVPLHAMETYARRLVAHGYKVAVCEQMEPPGRGLVRRAVTRVLSPGTVVEPGLLPAMRDNYLVAVAYGHRGLASGAGLACVEASTGALSCTQWAAADLPDALVAEIQRLRPAEVLIAESQTPPRAAEQPGGAASEWADGCTVTSCPPHFFERESSRIRLCRHLGTPTLAAFGCDELPLAAAAAGAILAYLERMNPGLLRLVTGLTTYHTSGAVEVDGRTWAALEAVEPARGASNGPTLLSTLDATRTAMGARLLRRTLLKPLKDRAVLEARLDAVAALHADAALRQHLGSILDDLPDLERLTARVVQGTALPRDLHALATSLARVPSARAALNTIRAVSNPFSAIVEQMDSCVDVVLVIDNALAAPDASEGRLLRRGYSQDLDALVESVGTSRQWIAALEPRERERTGIKSLRVSYNKVFGYSIEVTRPNLARVPEDYERRQTLATGERYITPELKEHEARVLQAEERITALERELYAALLARLATYHTRLRQTAEALAQVDVWLSLAEVAAVRNYVRPELRDDRGLAIRDGRHPVVEAALDGHEFIPNDTLLDGVEAGTEDPGTGRVLLLTGPNMAGKSTYLRQVAQIVLLAQVGAFVPASSARIGLVDRIFTRVGADDDLARGISTFMREMTETAYILRHATSRSLVVLDEVGRGTSTHDGLAIARAVVEYLHDHVGARTLFATHFHELANLADSLSGVRPAAMEVYEHDGHVVFLHRLGPGRASQSYGIHVARMAGLPATVTARAATLLADARTASALEDHDADHGASASVCDPPATAPAPIREHGPRDLLAAESHPDHTEHAHSLVLGLASLSVAAMTPMEAINMLFSLQQRAVEAVRAGNM